MEIFIQTLISLLAILGLILTTMSFFEYIGDNKYINNIYRIYNKKRNKDGKIAVNIKLSNISEEKEDYILEKIKEEESLDIVKIADEIYIEND